MTRTEFLRLGRFDCGEFAASPAVFRQFAMAMLSGAWLEMGSAKEQMNRLHDYLDPSLGIESLLVYMDSDEDDEALFALSCVLPATSTL